MKKLKSFLLLFIFVLFCEFFICSFSFVADASNVSREQDLANNTPNTNSSIPDITTYSPACILMDAKTGKILYEKNSSDVLYAFCDPYNLLHAGQDSSAGDADR